jgi:hypothetical protein
MSRNEAIELVLKYDGKCSNEYIQEFCDYIEITVDEFWSTVEKFRGNMWKKDNSGELKNCIWEELKKE